MATQKLLLPYNFTSLDQKALNFVTNTFGKLDNIELPYLMRTHRFLKLRRIHFHNRQAQRKLSYLSQKVKENEALLMRSKTNLSKAVSRKSG